MATKVIQLRRDAENPVLRLGSYEPQTEYWQIMVALANSMIQDRAKNERETEHMQFTANLMMETLLFSGADKREAYEWAEFVMAINHVLWLIHGISEEETDTQEYLNPIGEVLTNLYYEWHDKALDTLKGDALAEYLRITD